jgi:CheY-like chemotaxis protein
VLGELGYRVTVAPDGRLGLKVLEQLPAVDLLFTDVGLPGGLTAGATCSSSTTTR